MNQMLLFAELGSSGNTIVDAGNGVLESGQEATSGLIATGVQVGDQTATQVTEVVGNTGQQITAAGEQTWQLVTQQFSQAAGTYLPNLAAALIILTLGWFAALLVAWVVRTALRKLDIDARLARSTADNRSGKPVAISRAVGRGVFWMVMLITAVAFFQALGLAMVTEPLQAFLNQVFAYAPRVIAATVILAAAWIVARAARFVVAKSLTAAKLDRRLTREAGVEGDEELPLTKTLAESTYWLVYLLFLPAVLDALAVPGLLAPVQSVVQQMLGFLPNLFGAAVILTVGWFVARIVQRIVTNLLAVGGGDRVSEQMGLGSWLGNQQLSKAVGLVVYVLILVPVLVGSLNALQITAVTQPASDMLNTILSTLPGIVAACLVVGVAYAVGRIVSALAVTTLSGIGFDRLPVALGVASEPVSGKRTPSQIVGTLVMVAIVLFATMQALPMLGFDLLAGMMSDFLAFASHVLVGLVIFGFGLYLAKLIADLIRDSQIANAGLLAHTARVAVLVLAGAMGLQQMGLAEEVINLAFGITLGAIAIAGAIAFGIGGRDAAKELVDDIMKKRRTPANGRTAGRGSRQPQSSN